MAPGAVERLQAVEDGAQVEGGSSGIRRVVCLGDPVMDVLAHVGYEFLDSIGAAPGGCFPIPQAEMENLLEQTRKLDTLTRVPGGSAANVAKALARLLPKSSHSVSFVGMVGRDATADEYDSKLREQRVVPRLVQSDSGAPTATCCCLVTPDGQRTMRTSLCAALELTSGSLLPAEWCDGAAAVHCEGYALYRPQMAEEALREAKARGLQVSLDLASFETVRNCRDTLQRLLSAGLIDIVFCNEEEAAAVAGPHGLLHAELEDHPHAQAAAGGSGGGVGSASVGGVSVGGVSVGVGVSVGDGGSGGQQRQRRRQGVAGGDGNGGLGLAEEVAGEENTPPASSNGVDDGGNSSAATAPNGATTNGGSDGAANAPNGATAGGGEDVVRRCQDVLLRHCQVVVVSRGAKGCMARSRSGQTGVSPSCRVEVSASGVRATMPAKGVKVVDTVGAGDYFTGGFLSAYLRGATLQQAAVCGCIAGTAAVQSSGALLGQKAVADVRSGIAHVLAATV